MNVLSKKGGRNHSLVPHSLDSNTIRDSMQYYRVWIYSCNWVLGITSAIFTVFAAFVLADVRLSLLRGVELYHPTFIYAYTALIVQCGVIQVIGCLGAQRLSHKLLSIYWILLLILTIGDVVVGLVWVFKLEDVKHSLRPILTREFIAKYATDADFTKTWNRVQTQEHCCGVNGPLDFDKFSSEVRLQILQEQNVGRTEAALYLSLPESCCTSKDFIPPPTQDYAFGPFSLSRPPDNYSRSGPGSGSVPPTSVPQSPLALFLNSNSSSGEQISSSSEDYDSMPPLAGLVSIPNVPNNRRRHFIHHRKKFPYNFQGVNGSELNNSLAGGAAASTEDTPEVTEISVPFTCRNPDTHGHGHSQHRRNIQIIPSSNSNDDGEVGKNPSTQKEGASSAANGIIGANQNSGDSGGGGSPLFRKANRRHASIPSPSATPNSNPTKKTRVRIYRNGCGIKLMQWLDHISGILFILGFCIIGFIKACFLIILRYEIREMIEKIHTLDQVEDGIFSGCNASSPTRLALLQKQSSLSSGQCHFTGVTIKSPQGDGGSKCFHHHEARNSFVSQASIDVGGGRHHHTACCAKALSRDRTGMRRPSGRSLCECDRNSSHSQETVNMTVMITTQQQQKDGNSGDERGPESEPISLIVPKQDERDLRRSRFANYAAWDSNVSGESSTSTGGGEFGIGRPGGKTEIVQVEMENLSSIQFVDESDTSLISVGPPVEEELTTKNDEDGTLLIPQQPGRLSAATTRRRNGNNNSVDSSDSVMALIGTAV